MLARLAGMHETEWCLYQVTESWLRADVASVTGLPHHECERLWREVERVRASFRAQQPARVEQPSEAAREIARMLASGDDGA